MQCAVTISDVLVRLVDRRGAVDRVGRVDGWNLGGKGDYRLRNCADTIPSRWRRSVVLGRGGGAVAVAVVADHR